MIAQGRKGIGEAAPIQRRRGERGAAAVEMAIVLPLLLLLVFGAIEFGLMFFNQQVITNASREGARAGIVAGIPHLTAAEIQTVVNAYCGTHLISFAAATPTTTVSTDSASGTPSDAVFGNDLTVLVQYNYTFLVLPQFVGWLSGGTTLSAQTVMRYE